MFNLIIFKTSYSHNGVCIHLHGALKLLDAHIYLSESFQGVFGNNDNLYNLMSWSSIVCSWYEVIGEQGNFYYIIPFNKVYHWKYMILL